MSLINEAKPMETPTSSPNTMHADGSTTPRQSRHGRASSSLLDIPPPPYNGQATETSSLLSYDSFIHDDDFHARPEIHHVPPSPGTYSQFTDDSVATVRRYSAESTSDSGSSRSDEGYWSDADKNEWLPCISVWLIAAIVFVVVLAAAAFMYMLVTQ